MLRSESGAKIGVSYRPERRSLVKPERHRTAHVTRARAPDPRASSHPLSQNEYHSAAVSLPAVRPSALRLGNENRSDMAFVLALVARGTAVLAERAVSDAEQGGEIAREVLAVLAERSDEDEEDEDGGGAESESDFEPSDSEDESESDEESDTESLVDSAEDDVSDDDDNEDDGMDWDELEEEAMAADEEASESDGKKRKRRAEVKKRRM